MYRITIYEGGEKSVEEFSDEDDMRDRVDQCLNDLENGSINSFTTSRISQGRYPIDTPFWEKHA
jgi:hypothetical protein